MSRDTTREILNFSKEEWANLSQSTRHNYRRSVPPVLLGHPLCGGGRSPGAREETSEIPPAGFCVSLVHRAFAVTPLHPPQPFATVEEN